MSTQAGCVEEAVRSTDTSVTAVRSILTYEDDEELQRDVGGKIRRSIQ